MDALQRALNSVQRSYIAAKAGRSTVTSELLAHGPRNSVVQRGDFGRASNQLAHFRGWVYAAIRPIAQSIAGQPIKVGRAKSGARRRKAIDRTSIEEFDSHPLLDLLCNPNPLMTSWSMMFSTVASLELTGRSLWWFDREGDRDIVFPIPTSWIVDFKGSRSYEAFMVRPPRSAAEPIALPADCCCYFHYPHPSDPHAACSPLQAAGLAVNADEAIQASQAETFRQGINPRHAVIVGRTIGADGQPTGERPTLTGAQRRQLIGALKARYAGWMNREEPIILDGLVEDLKRMSNAPSEMDYMDSSKLTKARIIQIFGTNPIIMGEVEGANRASALAAEEHFAQFTVNPKIELMSEVLNTTLGPRYDDVTVWVEPIVPADAEMDLKKRELLCKSQAITVNELRSWNGLEPVDWGDVPVGVTESLDEQIRRLAD